LLLSCVKPTFSATLLESLNYTNCPRMKATSSMPTCACGAGGTGSTGGTGGAGGFNLLILLFFRRIVYTI
jgi:hypothetical protein